MRLEARIFVDSVGWTIVMVGAVWLAAANGFPYQEITDRGYLGGVVGRSFESKYQAGLMAGLMAVPVHALWVYLVHSPPDRAAAYDRYAAWGQTLFTSLGFLGTIIGISLAVGGLEAAMSEGDPASLISGLSTAFDTTFLGLTASVFLMVLRTFARLGQPVKP